MSQVPGDAEVSDGPRAVGEGQRVVARRAVRVREEGGDVGHGGHQRGAAG